MALTPLGLTVTAAVAMTVILFGLALALFAAGAFQGAFTLLAAAVMFLIGGLVGVLLLARERVEDAEALRKLKGAP